MTKNLPVSGSLTASGASYEGVTHAGIAVVAADTGRVMLAQRAMDDSDDPEVQESWEFPGGGLDVPEEPLAGAMREFDEEIGLDLPTGEVVNGWRSGDGGHYQGFVYSTPAEFDLEGFVANEETQAVAWVMPGATDDMKIRPEMADFDWSLLDVSGNEDKMDETDEALEYSAEDFDLDGPIPVHGVIVPEEMSSGDKRAFAAGSMTRRPMRLPFSDQHTSVGGHEGSVVVGSVDRMMRRDGLIHWEGAIMNSVYAEPLMERMEFFDGRYGVSVDGDSGSMDEARSEASGTMWFDAVRASGLTAVAIPAFHQAYVAFGRHPEMPSDEDEALSASAFESGDLIGASTFKRGPGWVTDPVPTRRIHDYWTKKGEPGYALVGWGTPGDFTRAKKLIGAKIAANSPDKMRFLNQIIAQWHHDALGYWPGDKGKPGNAPASATMHTFAQGDQGDQEVDHDELGRRLAEVEDSDLEPSEDGESVWEAVLVSSAAGGAVRPPLSYFHRQEDSGALTIEEPDANGFRHVHGYAAEWGVCHIGMSGQCVEPPRTGSDDYPEFHLGITRTDEGVIRTGVLTYDVGHRDAKTILSESPTQAMFDNIKNAWSAVRVGEDDTGIWFSGVVLPRVDAADLTSIEASGQVSGEWKAGAMRACLTVNVPGFPVVSASAEYDENGNVMAMAASAFGSAQVTNGVEESECAKIAASTDIDDPMGEIAAEVMNRIAAKARMDALRQEQALSLFNENKKIWGTL